MEERQDLAAPKTLKEVFVEAAAAAGERIQRDGELFAADEEVQALLEALEKHLFDARLDVAFLVASSGTRRRARERFAARYGSLKTYFNTLRVEVAARLLRETGAPIKDIAKAVGFDLARTFSRTFKKILGKTPKQWRQLPESELESPPEDEDGEEEDGADVTEPFEAPLRLRAAQWRRRVTLGPQQATELRQLLRSRYSSIRSFLGPDLRLPDRPLPFQRTRPVRVRPAGGELEALAAATLLEAATSLPREDRQYALRECLRFDLATVVPRLHRLAVRLLAGDRRRALALAELAVEAVAAHFDASGEFFDWQALAWVHLGQVRLAAGDVGAADQALMFAWAEWATPRAEPDRGVEAEMWQLKAALRGRQRRHRDAARALDRVLEICPGDRECRIDRAEAARCLHCSNVLPRRKRNRRRKRDRWPRSAGWWAARAPRPSAARSANT